MSKRILHFTTWYWLFEEIYTNFCKLSLCENYEKFENKIYRIMNSLMFTWSLRNNHRDSCIKTFVMWATLVLVEIFNLMKTNWFLEKIVIHIIHLNVFFNFCINLCLRRNFVATILSKKNFWIEFLKMTRRKIASED